MDKYQWTSTGMSITAVENGPMRYVREVDYDALQAKVEGLTKPVEDADVRAHIINIAGAYPKAADALERLARENAEYEEGNDADAEVIQLLQAKIEELQEKIDDLINARNLAWDKGYSQGRDDAHQTITGLQAKVEELEDMLQSAIERECYNERHIEQLETKLKASLQECDYCGTALKQEQDEPIDDLVERIKPR